MRAAHTVTDLNMRAYVRVRVCMHVFAFSNKLLFGRPSITTTVTRTWSHGYDANGLAAPSELDFCSRSVPDVLFAPIRFDVIEGVAGNTSYTMPVCAQFNFSDYDVTYVLVNGLSMRGVCINIPICQTERSAVRILISVSDGR